MQQGEQNLSKLLRHLDPQVQPGIYVFCFNSSGREVPFHHRLFTFREPEGETVVVRRDIANTLGLTYDFEASWIILKVHSALSAIGLTAAFSNALAQGGIPCNVVAAFHHDHLFVPVHQQALALEILKNLSASAVRD